jgi:hypothetical protein
VPSTYESSPVPTEWEKVAEGRMRALALSA